MTGVVITYYKDKGYGFIDSEDERIFFHISNIEKKHADEEIEVGTKFNFQIGTNNKGKQAINIKVIGNEINKFIKIGNDRIKLSNIKAYGIFNMSEEYIQDISNIKNSNNYGTNVLEDYLLKSPIMGDSIRKQREEINQRQQASIDEMKNNPKYNLALKNELIYLYIETYQKERHSFYKNEIEENIYDILNKLDSIFQTS